MLRSVCSLIVVLLFVIPVEAEITITESDIEHDSEGYYYLYELTFADLSTKSTKLKS